MRITIIGWYGTETIGDRAILAGIISFFNKAYDTFEIKLGSLNPFFSERTLNEDYSFYKEIIKQDIKIDIFNSTSSKELVTAIKNSDLVAMGGGPLMDLNELFMVEYAFKKAKKLGIKTVLMGCGIGPLFNKKYKRSVLNIVQNSDLSILRDQKSKDNLEDLYKQYNLSFDRSLIKTSLDPAVECALEYNKLYPKKEQDYVTINLREFPVEYNEYNESKNINNELKNIVESVSLKYPNRPIRLIPMHYFHIGGDDRIFLNSIALSLNANNIYVQNKNLTLKETIEVYQNAFINIGMRFHSVVLQTVSSGKNFVLDYTEPKRGKIFGFLQDIDTDGFYVSRYISLQEDEINSKFIGNEGLKFEINIQEINNYLKVYIDKLKELA